MLVSQYQEIWRQGFFDNTDYLLEQLLDNESKTSVRGIIFYEKKIVRKYKTVISKN